jgi:hypothetical protein
MNLLLVILAHADRNSLRSTVENARAFCPRARLLFYNSGPDPHLGRSLPVEHFPKPRTHEYARITPFFLELFEWAVRTGDAFDAIVNLETDLLFIRPGYEAFVEDALERADYVAPNLIRHRPLQSYWRPLRSLRPEFERWFDLLGFRHFHGSFSPAQIFSRRYVQTLVGHRGYRDLCYLVGQNRSFSLQEVLFPTLTDFLGLRLEGYPAAHRTSNRYRPYQAVAGVKRALAIPDAHFVHPVRRPEHDPARRFIGELQAGLTSTVASERCHG